LLVILVRTVILFAAVIIVMRLMGKREIGQLQPVEFVVALMISELAAIPMGETGIPLLNGLLPIFMLLVLQATISYVSLKSERARALFSGKPSILINGGHIDEAELYRLNYNINDLLEQLRAKNFPDVSEIAYAILETNGDLSILPKAAYRPATPRDFNLAVTDAGFPVALVLDGKINRYSLNLLGKDADWLRRELRAQGYPDRPEEIFFASGSSNGKLHVQLKQGKQ
jgi:uncharacterized membrane protein YcaP (DUF421 family)